MTTSQKFDPTPEQQAVLEAFATGHDLVIEAGAGTGKTATLQLIAENTDRQGTYVVYNKAAQMDALDRFPKHPNSTKDKPKAYPVDCRTAHSLAYGGMMRMPNGREITRRAHDRKSVWSRELVKPLGIPAGFEDGDQFIPDEVIASAAVEAVAKYAQSADDKITAWHVQPVDGVEDQDSFKRFVVPFAEKVWADVQKPNGVCKVTPDHYLKMWALTKPRIKGDFILLDEAQDTNAVLLKVIEDQPVQRVIVGDRCQQLYAWRGAVNAMTTFTADQNLVLSQSFRFGQAVADNANKFLALLDTPLSLKGFDQIDSKIETLIDADAILCRTNATVIAEAIAAQARGRTAYIVGGTDEIRKFAEGARDLQEGRKARSPELAIFKSWKEVQKYAASPEGTDMRVSVKLVDEYGVDAILQVCDNCKYIKESQADVVVSTAHKSKGREWNRVRIAEDFKAPEDNITPSHADLCLMYVAVTRAKLVLDPGALSWINNYAAAAPVAA